MSKSSNSECPTNEILGLGTNKGGRITAKGADNSLNTSLSNLSGSRDRSGSGNKKQSTKSPVLPKVKLKQNSPVIKALPKQKNKVIPLKNLVKKKNVPPKQISANRLDTIFDPPASIQKTKISQKKDMPVKEKQNISQNKTTSKIFRGFNYYRE